MSSGTTLVLYHSPYSTCSQKVRLVLAEKGIEYTAREISFAREEQLTPEYLQLNSNGVVPTLVHDGEPVTDSSCIMEYLDEVFPEPALSPGTPLGRARLRTWLRYLEEVPTAAARVPSFQRVFLPVLSRVRSAEQFDQAAARRPIRKGFYQRMQSGKGFTDAELQNSVEQLQQTVDRIERALARSPWIVGESFSLVECCVTPVIDRLDDLGMHTLWAELPRVTNWFARIRARPSYAKAFYPGSRLSQRAEFAAVMAQRRHETRSR
nr:protein LigF [uncultured bacterium]